MTLEELRNEMAAILSLEEQPTVDWREVDARCLIVVERLNTEADPLYPHDVVYHFLEDPDARQKSPRYALGQRERLREWLTPR